MNDPRILPLGDRAIVVHFGDKIDETTFRRVRALARRLDQRRLLWVVEYVPAYTTLALHYDPLQISHAQLCRDLEPMLAEGVEGADELTRIMEIPVCYGGEFGGDLEFVAQHNGLATDEVVAIHSSPEYLVHMIGFSPGFPYLGGMSPRIATPRRSSPRLKVPAGSVGIAGGQTGIYSLETPGGWQIIGRTPLALFRPADHPPTLLTAGDVVRFRPITPDEFDALREAGT